MKKLILFFALIAFTGAAKTFAQTSDAKAAKPATAAAAPVVLGKATTVSEDQAVATPAATKTEVKSEAKKACCSHSSKSCCMSKKSSASKKECSQKQAEKAEIKSENTETIKN